MLYVSEESMTKSSNIFQGQNQPEKRDARSRSPPPTHNPRRCHLNHELVPAEENLNRIDSFLMIPSSLLSEQPYRELPGDPNFIQALLDGGKDGRFLRIAPGFTPDLDGEGAITAMRVTS